jgi:branched-chain amino acid transport system permease protein
MRAKSNAGMVQIFATFGLAILIQGAAQYLFTPDYRNVTNTWFGGRTVEVFGLFLPLPQIYGGFVSVAAFAGLYLLMSRTDFGKALEATREDQGAVALVGIDRNRVFALGWGLGAALVGLAGSVLAIFFYVHPGVGGPFALIAYVVVALGGFGSVFGALAAGIIVGFVEALSTLVAPSAMKSIGVYSLYLLVVFIRPSGLFGRL